jgi:DNA (cytosine-5)-methyltransferase 1
VVRIPAIRASLVRPGELVVDSFAGGGGASTGIEQAIGRPVDIAINHSPVAIAMHRANHPGTKHFCENVWQVDPREACGGRPVALAWFSPTCTHFSRAKGAGLRDQGIRGLAWVVIRWAHDVRPRTIILENVEEFETWGPLGTDGMPDKKRAGLTFRQWLGRLTALGYRVEFRSLVAADYGTPTTRRRLFLVARRDDRPICWPAPTHGQGRSEPWRTAAEIIDWSLPCHSIFERTKPLAEATCRRIAEGIRRYVVECGEPFIVPVKTWGGGGNDPRSLGLPMRTITASKRGEFALAVPTLIARSWGERKGQTPRVPGLEKPLGTVVSGGIKHALVAAFLSKHYGDPDRQAGGGRVIGQDLARPVGTVTARDHHSLTTAFLTKFYGECRAGAPVTDPLPTVTSGGGRGGGHLAEVRAFLLKFYKSGGQWQGCNDPLHTITAKARFGLCTIHGEAYQIVDIGLRMLQPHELFAAQGFPEHYEIAPLGPSGGPLTKTEQVELAGNSVCPPIAEAIVAAQVRGNARAEVA